MASIVWQWAAWYVLQSRSIGKDDQPASSFPNLFKILIDKQIRRRWRSRNPSGRFLRRPCLLRTSRVPNNHQSSGLYSHALHQDFLAVVINVVIIWIFRQLHGLRALNVHQLANVALVTKHLFYRCRRLCVFNRVHPLHLFLGDFSMRCVRWKLRRAVLATPRTCSAASVVVSLVSEDAKNANGDNHVFRFQVIHLYLHLR